MARTPNILLLSDSPGGIGLDLDVLYPGRVRKLNFLKDRHSVRVLKPFDAVITLVQDGVNIEKLDYSALEHYAAAGGRVVSCLFEYARHRGLNFSKTYVGAHVRPALRIEVENEITHGFARGDEVWWYGTVSSAPDTAYSNQMFQRQILDIKASEAVEILATSTLNGGGVMVREKIGKGQILALDLRSPDRPFFNSHGSTNKYLFIGNLIGRTVRYGRHYPKRLTYDEFVAAMHDLAGCEKRLRLRAEGVCSDGRQMYSLRLGDEEKPTVYLGAAIHGWEWENAFGLLRFAELLAAQPRLERLAAEHLHFVIVPIQNPAGYDAFTRQNARGVDLNRNFAVGWAELPVVQDVVVPWDYNYKGARAASEPETQVIQGLIDRYRPVCAIDFHTADYVMLLPHRGEDALIQAIRKDIRRRLRNRYITQRPYNGPYQQVNMDRCSKGQKCPYLICYAAEKGSPAAFLIEMSGNRDDVHALVMNTDTVVEICLAAAKQSLKWVMAD